MSSVHRIRLAGELGFPPFVVTFAMRSDEDDLVERPNRANFGSDAHLLHDGVADRNTRKDLLYFGFVDNNCTVDDDIGDAGRGQ